MGEQLAIKASAPSSGDNLYIRLRVSDVIEESHDSMSIVFDTRGLDDIFAYRPGQFLTLRVPVGDAHVARCYSLASSPFLNEPLKVTVKRVEGGIASNWLIDSLRANDELEVLAPAGVFTPRVLDTDLLLIAGGSGVTPIMSILKSALRMGKGKVALIYANRDERSVIFAQELSKLAQQYPERMVVHHWLESVQGLPSSAQIAALAGDFTSYEAFICGPDKFMDCAVDALLRVGMDRKHVHVERFISLSQDPGIPVVPMDCSDEPTGDEAALTVLFDGVATQLLWHSERTLLDTLLMADIPAPYSCKEGKCSACICKLTRGSATMVHNEVLNQDDIAEGWLLACQAVPNDAAVSVSFDE
ncbi:ferredoxin--NADP reductase [Sphingobium sp. Cam5-1]|uniref:ferredoxin--NADP reductase n=1 Tax=Sphingobium sp. Cam5-1 TaxID=2789327 RepID=UPI0018AD16B4|nr:ferredoxin--NADP reductase [Sphingobium sp. Cam5-1]QPI75018.1 ferredoxin--NADP reductase [Sphingobium sp. Cam5-1]